MRFKNFERRTHNRAFQEPPLRKRGACTRGCTDSGFVAPRSSVPPTLAREVRQLAWRATTTLDFVLKAGNLACYTRLTCLRLTAVSRRLGSRLLLTTMVRTRTSPVLIAGRRS